MFGIDFSELMVILVVALIVIGPERLPKVARTCGHLWGRAQRYVKDVKADISREMAIDDISQFRQSLRQEASSAEQAMMHVKQTIDQQVLQLNSSVSQPDKAITQPIPK
ncbi:MAG: twin-arginine translocase subunit TatB [Nitrosomonadales bacterium]|nr:twin-arginine translocase subunit TatB [Nitrosomonadales bacterium]